MTLPHNGTQQPVFTIRNMFSEHYLDATGTAWFKPQDTQRKFITFYSFDEAWEFICNANEPGERSLPGIVEELRP